MPLLAALAGWLAWLGRQGTRAVAASLFIGILLPPLAALLKPVFPYALFALLCLAFLRVNPTEVRRHFRHPLRIAAAASWMMLATPVLIGLILVALNLSERVPGLYIAMILQAASPPLISAPTLAALMGLDAALSLATQALGAIKARTIILPGQYDSYFPPVDSFYEASKIPGAECRPIPSTWGHMTLWNPDDRPFIDAAINDALGKWLLALTSFYTYVAFSQYFLIWYSNLPEETIWYRHRMVGSWLSVSLAMPFLRFLIPFPILLCLPAKRNLKVIGFMAVWSLIVEYIDLYWIVMPTYYKTGPQPHWLDLATLVTTVSICGLVFWSRFRAHKMVPVGDLRLEQSLHFENA